MSPVLQEVVRGLRVKHYPRGQIILYQGDEPDEVLVLQKGIIKIHDIDEQGNDKILHLVKPYSLIPLAFFLADQNDIQWFYTALTDCDVCVLPMDNLLKQMHTDNDLAECVLESLSHEVHELLVRLSSLGKTNVHDKVVAALKFLAVHYATQRRSGWWRVNFSVNHQFIADLTGVTRESVAMIMRDFQQKQLIRNPRQTILEINMTKLVK